MRRRLRLTLDRAAGVRCWRYEPADAALAAELARARPGPVGAGLAGPGVSTGFLAALLATAADAGVDVVFVAPRVRDGLAPGGGPG